jgi:hypothetical protein
MARDSTRNAQRAYQRQCPEQSPGQVKGRVELQLLKNNMQLIQRVRVLTRI